MAATQAIRFDRDWLVLGQADIGDGFFAALFQKVDASGTPTGEKVLGIRGTDASHWGIDFAVDVVAIALLGTNRGLRQYQSLETFYGQMVTTGKLGASELITVSGHSLGGFLAQAFAADYDLVVKAAYTYNAPGFSGSIPVGGVNTEILEFFGITDASIPNAKIFNARAIEGFSATAGLGQMIGFVNAFNIEKSGPVSNHSIITLTDSLAVQQLLSELDYTLSQDATNYLVRTSSNQHGNTLELLVDSVRHLVLGTGKPSTEQGNRDMLYANLQELATAVRSVAGTVRIDGTHPATASTSHQDFAAFLSLTTGATFSLRSLDAAAVEDALKGVHATAYADWNADREALVAGASQDSLNFTDTYLNDRAAFLNWRSLAYTADQTFVNSALAPTDRTFEYHWKEVGSTQDNALLVSRVQGLGTTPAQIISFGGDSADSLSGNANPNFGDRLYGGAGDDILNGLAGSDYLEG
ncbi:hypothetical protein, partial [Caenimonas sp. SL110]|uniref:hypothetical protein n=1 Tax=Caenimonas sp. SL110 TaxID=1450524 RepID=UPI00065332E1